MEKTLAPAISTEGAENPEAPLWQKGGGPAML